ncbi:hypothetical protein NEIELOOT_01034 [Neisseria elongata subsp. glycolytica ATCC 29315]|uniref:Uncharacterized protein n=1 Tax=Neisseria elongata subsp. glycolytica ATCC 29315 TaxID=546263 RepID=D4DPP7_NEIEG|nr:hypothetical protein NEIELOOT_01034 [Neisseria elongata subsp. glycolytica ATCC 29315]
MFSDGLIPSKHNDRQIKATPALNPSTQLAAKQIERIGQYQKGRLKAVYTFRRPDSI